MLHHLYSRLARARRRYYTRRPHLRRRLTAPVISIGNLTVGGSGKTPIAAEVARMLIAMGERPAILSRGYGRTNPVDGVVVVSDGTSIHADFGESGDEPLMLARQVPGAAVLVASSRYLAGRVAESRLGATVHVLDDGFQHFDLMRDVDLLIAPDTVDDMRTLPTGRFREPLDVAADADALLVERGRLDVAAQLNVPTVFEFSRSLRDPAPEAPTYAFAGIARPDRFFSDLTQSGWRLTGQRSFADHHPYSSRDVDELLRAARASGAQMLVTTEKDMTRLPAVESDLAVVAVALDVSIEPGFSAWMADRLRSRRSA